MDAKLKHLEFVQATIARMANHSFLLKAWAAALVVAVFALAAKDADGSFVLVAYVPLWSFWILDGFYLQRERAYRNMYAHVAETLTSDVDLKMELGSSEKTLISWLRAFFSLTLTVFYLPLILLCLLVFLITR